MTTFKHRILVACIALGTSIVGTGVLAAVSATEAATLGKELTPLGAERAGNKSGSIPEWTGCPELNAPMEKLKAGDRRWEPYASEKPLYTVTAANMGQYAANLSEGVRALLQKYPQTMSLQVFTTHRTHCAPAWVNEATSKNAVTAKRTVKGDNDGIEGAINGIPFPIPKDGAEVRWNSNLRWRGESYETKVRHYAMTTSGDRVMGTQALQYDQFESYRKGVTAEENAKQGYLSWMFMQATDAPSFRAGESLLLRDSSNYVERDRQTWQYLVGQRRVRRAPNVGWDTPDFVNSGANFFDEVFGGTYTSQERYDYTLVGKKDMLIPYNDNKIFSLKEDQIFAKNHHNPDALRWEMHRVWVVEANLKPGKRHAVSKRVYYVDEDTWGTALVDGWDPSGKLWRVSLCPSYFFPDMPGVMSAYSDILYVLDGAWSSRNTAFYDPGFQLKPVPMKAESAFTADAISGRSVR